nr:MerR family transcriptional regulator [Kibdelosporangium sp. MJ126-NF4]CEL23542.1 MerR-family transcriptional regulator [Kibdelosporangium sp. MJ126-NF4]CTQ89156.1 MerR-family transcriptional regulator [Kibdelosporangium sp. MJ126-NF4]
MRIGEASAAAGLTARALRYYEQRGLLVARRTASGHREYDEDDVRRLRTVRGLLETGLTIDDVQAAVAALDVEVTAGDDDCLLADITARRIAELDERIKRLTDLRARLATALAHRFDKQFATPDQRPSPRAKVVPCAR